MSKIILSDADGVLLDWNTPFHEFMKSYATRSDDPDVQELYKVDLQYHDLPRAKARFMVKMFNQSAMMGYLGPMRDSVEYVTKIHKELGYQFRIISSMGDFEPAVKLREMNLRNLYGDAIESVKCLPMGEPKDMALEEYRNSDLWWIEDHPNNFRIGVEHGLRSILIDHPYNKSTDITGGTRVTHWKEIYEKISKE